MVMKSNLGILAEPSKLKDRALLIFCYIAEGFWFCESFLEWYFLPFK